MDHIIFEQLHNAGLLSHDKLVESSVRQLSINDIIDFAQQSCILTSAVDLTRDKAIFAQSASLSLGCSRWPCRSLRCRLKRAEQLAQYAALYGDRVYIKNLFSDYGRYIEHDVPINEVDLQQYFAEDIIIYTYLKPVIDAGRIIPITTPYMCVSCLSKHSLGFKDDQPLRDAMQTFTGKMENCIEVTASNPVKRLYRFHATGPDDYIDHGATNFGANHFINILQKMPRVIDRIHMGEDVKLSRTAIKRIGLVKSLAQEHFNSIFFELILAQSLGTSFLTEMPVHIEFIKSLYLTHPNIEREAAIEKNLSCIVPFVNELNLSEIIKLRESEEDSFILFKSALAKAVEEYKKNYGAFTEAEAHALYHDLIRPELAKLELCINKSSPDYSRRA
ncbi:MAG: hypothetical protein ACYC6A_20470 [Armatimonadota bacterium]